MPSVSLITACVEAGLIPPPKPRLAPPPAPAPPPPIARPVPARQLLQRDSLYFLLMHSYFRPCFICGQEGDECGHREPNVELAILFAAGGAHA